MLIIHGSKSRLQFGRDMCQALYSPQGMKGRNVVMCCVPSRRVSDAHHLVHTVLLVESV